MLLQHGESALRSAYAVLEPGGHPTDESGPGVLYLTSHRLIFEAPDRRGIVRDLVQGRTTRTVLDASLLAVRNASVRRGRIAKPRLWIDLPGHAAAFDVLDPEGWVTAVAQAKRALPVPGSTPVATHTIERQVVKVRCRYCGRLGNEVDGRCATCGAPL